MKKLFILPLLLSLNLSANAVESEPTTVSDPAMPLVSAAIRYGMLANAYLNSPSGMITEGYRYQIRSLYLSYLRELLQEPGNTIDKLNEQLMTDWMTRLGREQLSPEVLVNIRGNLEIKLAEWSNNALSGQFKGMMEKEEVMPTLEQRIKACKRVAFQPASDPDKRRSCHQSKQLTREISSHLIDPNLLKNEMLELLPAYANSLIQVSGRPYFRAFKTSKEDFQESLITLMTQGYSARQLAEILEFAGVDYPQVFDQLYFHALKTDKTIHE
ncbi:hypothetical protein EOPP23_15770 [Endozoicomonas sp. OPT23]|uniref:hypothetical protein n=1 Tax=Endozoicomonas sp. OPT23 TaxID=2072845 RepID=UPI00129B73EA|nr:hypothetical protein [Endozoicomonas sp. OPT23]MRI34447.1 hypothetical protein [Endozoicomonas sp. OPT23]